MVVLRFLTKGERHGHHHQGPPPDRPGQADQPERVRAADLPLHDELNGQVYGLQCLGHGPEEGYRFWKADGSGVCDVDTSGNDPLCDCPDCTFRERLCKHGLALIQLRKQGAI